MMTVMN